MKCPHTSHVEGDQLLNSQHVWACWDNWLPQSNLHLPWPNELTFCPDINGYKFQSKFRALDTDDVNQRTSLLSVQGQSAWYCFMFVVLLFYVIWVRYTKYSVNAQTPITTILATHLLHEFIVNVKYTMDWSNRKPYICLSFNFWRQYSANGTCLTSVNMQKYVTSLWLLWKTQFFPDLDWNSLTC